MLRLGLIFGFSLRYKFLFVSNVYPVQPSVRYVPKFIFMVTWSRKHLLSVQIHTCVGLVLKFEIVFALGSCFPLTYQIPICVRVKFALVLDLT